MVQSDQNPRGEIYLHGVPKNRMGQEMVYVQYVGLQTALLQELARLAG